MVKYLSALKCADIWRIFLECTCVHKFGHAHFRSANIANY